MAMARAVLVNPNTSRATTDRMLAAARAEACGRIAFRGVTAGFGASLITTPDELAVAGEAVLALAPELAREADGIIVSAFGDPGAMRLALTTEVPVIGIGEAGLREAARGGRCFCVATTTPGLVAAIDARVAQLGLGGSYAGVVLTEGDPVALTADPRRLEAELAAAIERAIANSGVEAVVIGGGPLSDAARQLAGKLPVTVVEPIPAAVRHLLSIFEH